jgi:hypothetical protein
VSLRRNQLLDSHTPYPYQRCYCSICRKSAGGGGYAITVKGKTARRPREIAILVVDRLDPRPIHREQLTAKQVQLAAEQHKLTKHVAEGVAVVAPEVSNGLEVRLQVPQQPIISILRVNAG